MNGVKIQQEHVTTDGDWYQVLALNSKTHTKSHTCTQMMDVIYEAGTDGLLEQQPRAGE